MKALLSLAATTLVFLGMGACKKNTVDVSDCMKQHINEWSKSDMACKGATLSEFEFQNNLVYGFNDNCMIADGSAPIFDENCNVLGMIGGITGNMKINGENFTNAKLIRVVWTK